MVGTVRVSKENKHKLGCCFWIEFVASDGAHELAPCPKDGVHFIRQASTLGPVLMVCDEHVHLITLGQYRPTGRETDIV